MRVMLLASSNYNPITVANMEGGASQSSNIGLCHNEIGSAIEVSLARCGYQFLESTKVWNSSQMSFYLILENFMALRMLFYT